MNQKNIIIIIIIILLAFLFVSTTAHPGQEKEGVLVPENFNEARLNRLQPSDKVMDAIGTFTLHKEFYGILPSLLSLKKTCFI